MELPFTNFQHAKSNPIDELLESRVSIEKSYAHYYFNKEGPVQEMMHAIKYLGRTDLAEHLGSQMGSILKDANWFDNMDCILPIPLHKKKESQRGYNQAYHLAKGLSESSGIDLNTNSLKRIKNTETQTKKSRLQRMENMENAFEVRQSVEKFNHILLVDDVITTGSTFESALQSLKLKSGAKMSILSLALAIDS